MENCRKFIIFGLGNAENQYAGTRHNIGFEVVNALAQKLSATFRTDRHAYIAEGKYKGRTLVLVMPTTYMNLSGKAVRYWMQQLNVPLENLIVISDDLNLPFGAIRMRPNGSSGGHNGLENITECLETDQWARIRVGIGNDFARGGQIDFVLGDLSQEEKEMVPDIAARIIQGCKDFSTIGVQRAMSALNTKNVAKI